MQVRHRFDVTTKCPQGGVTTYTVTMTLDAEPNAFTLVEDIDAYLKDIIAEPLFQEVLTYRLADRFGANVLTEGAHGRFQTRCSIGKFPDNLW